jgi:predicted aspartyl protease
MQPGKMVTGHLDKGGNACLKFHLAGTFHAVPGVELSGIIDSGFTGFLQIPAAYAFQLGVPLFGTTSQTLANGAQVTCLTALATATLGGRTEVGVVTIEFSSQDILIGMDFLRTFKMALIVSSSAVILVEEEELQKLSDQLTESPPTPEASQATPAAAVSPPAPSGPKT